MRKGIISLITIGCLYSSNLFAVDVEDNVKNYVKSKEWSSFAITEPTFGRVVAARAGTEDTRLNTTLTLTYPTVRNCKLTPIDLIIKLDKPIESANSTTIFGTVQIDDQKPLEVKATLQNDDDAEFIFITMPIVDFDKKIRNSKTLTVNFKGFGVMNFSSSGAQEAIDNATSICKNFI